MKARRRIIFGLVLAGILAGETSTISGEDWPAWRRDARRSATTPEQLPPALQRQWTLELPRLKPAWPEDPRLHFDAVYEPIVVGNTLFFGSSRNDSVTAVNLATGATRWRFFAEGPVRFAPLVVDGRIYFAADDGCLYCLRADEGQLVWRFRAAPAGRHVIGNERLISVWPVRGGPVHVDGQIHFTAGVWPFEGTFLFSVDARTGARVDSGPAVSPPQPDVVTLNDMTPQGYLAAGDANLFIPQGRSVVGCRDRKTGEFRGFQYSTSRVTNYHVCTSGRWLFHGAVCYDTIGKRELDMSVRTPVLAQDTIYAGEGGRVVAYDLTTPQEVERVDRRGKEHKVTVLTQRWSLANDLLRTLPDTDYDEWLAANPVVVDVKAGDRLYGHQGQVIFAVDVQGNETSATVSWRTQLQGTPSSMLVANGRLIVVTREGRIHSFGAEQVEPRVVSEDDRSAPPTAADWSDRVRDLLNHARPQDSYCVALGIGSGGLISELVRQSELRIIVVDPDAHRVGELRQQYDQAGLYGTRIVAHVADPAEFEFPPYLANVLVTEEPQRFGLTANTERVGDVFGCLRPYGGTAYLPMNDSDHESFAGLVAGARLASAEISRGGALTRLTRRGALPGSADWTHEYGDESNTLMSHDELVRAPLGVLWFGGPASDGSLFYNRHFWGPSMAVIGGRMFIQGPGKLTAVDVYTGRILWQIPLQGDDSYRPGRRGNDFDQQLSGFHFLAVEDSVYLVQEKSCLRLDPATGERMSEFKLSDPEDDWGRIRVKDDLLITVVFRTLDADKEKLPDARKLLAGQNSPVKILALNRHTGERLWSHEAEASFPVVAVGSDKIFCFDGALEGFYKDWERRGLIPGGSDIRHLKAIDLQSGKVAWKRYAEIIGTWVSYSADHDVVLLTNKKHVMAFRGRTGDELWKKYSEGVGFKGHPESLWDRVIVWKDHVLDQRGPGLSWNLETGERMPRLHPVTNREVAWEFTKAGHHCNYAIANPHLMTFRADTAGFCDIESGNTARLKGFRTGCRNSLIPAGGVLNAPNFAHGCVCGYSLFTSLAMVHLPESEVWGYSSLSLDPAVDRIRRIGINFGAPGDRMAGNGTMWFDSPNTGGSSPNVPIDVQGDRPRSFHQHSSLIDGEGTAWIAGSGLEGLTSVTIGLGTTDAKPEHFTVRMHFSEPAPLSVGQRVFSVALQDKTVIENLDLISESGGRHRGIVREFTDVTAESSVRIDFTAHQGDPLLCGVEIVAQELVSVKRRLSDELTGRSD